MNASIKEKITITLLNKKEETTNTFDIPKCNKCIEAYTKSKLSFTIDLAQSTSAKPITFNLTLN